MPKTSELKKGMVLGINGVLHAIKGVSASARTKPATLVTGLEVQVPEYIEQGELVKVNTRIGKLMSRA